MGIVLDINYSDFHSIDVPDSNDFEPERRHPSPGSERFIQRLSWLLVVAAIIGGFIVLLDVRFTLTLWGQVVSVGKEGFSPELKGVVLQSMLITGFAAVVGFWLGTTKQGQEQAQSQSRIAEAVPPVVAAVAATLPPAPIPANTSVVGDMNAQANGNVNIDGKN